MLVWYEVTGRFFSELDRRMVRVLYKLCCLHLPSTNGVKRAGSDQGLITSIIVSSSCVHCVYIALYDYDTNLVN